MQFSRGLGRTPEPASPAPAARRTTSTGGPGESALRARKGLARAAVGAGALAASLLAIGGTASAAVTVGSNITAFPNRDMVVAVGYNAGEELTVEVVRNGVVIGTTTGQAADTPEGMGLEVNHGPLGAPLPGDCWTNYTPDIIGGDVIRVTTARGVDTMTVQDVDFVGDPFLDPDPNVSIKGRSGVALTEIAVEFRRDKPDPRFRRGPFPAVSTGTAGEWKATFKPSSTVSAEGLTTEEQRDIALNEASWAAVVDNITETTIAEHGEPGGVAAGCTGSADPNAIAAGYTEPVNIASGDITLSGTAREGVANVSIKVGSLPAKAAALSTNATGVKTWTLNVTKAELATLPDGTITIAPTFDGLPGTNRTMVKDTVAPAEPTATPAAGTYPTTQFVTLDKPGEPAASKIHYTIGTGVVAEPTTASTVFTSQIAVSASQTIKARVIDAAGNPGAIGTFAYTIGTPPTVTARSPSAGATGVSVSGNVTATFSEAVSGVSGTTFQLRNTTTGALISAVVSRNGTTNQWILNPDVNLSAGTSYTATLTGGTTAIRDTAGTPLETTSWSFTTAASTNAAPTVTARAPAVNATNASRTANITATFSEAVQGVTTSTFTLRRESTGALVTATVTRNGTTNQWILNPSVDLATDARYTVTLTGGTTAIRDLAGAPLATTSWSFTTGPAPTVTSRSPASGALGVSRTANVTATFSEAVSGVSGTTFQLRNATTGTLISAVVSRNGTTNQWILNPSVTLSANTRYTARLTGGTTAIRDAAGNPLTTTSWSFTTGA